MKCSSLTVLCDSILTGPDTDFFGVAVYDGIPLHCNGTVCINLIKVDCKICQIKFLAKFFTQS